MRRYRLTNFNFDTRPSILGETLPDGVEPAVRKQWETSQTTIRADLQAEFGSAAWERKERDIVELGSAPWCVLNQYSEDLEEARSLFQAGRYKPATAYAGVVGERILNMLVDDLRAHYPAPSVKLKPVDKWCTDWKTMYTALKEWGVFDAALLKHSEALMLLRHQAAHPGASGDGRAAAIEAYGHLRAIVVEVLGALVPTRWFMQNHAHEQFIARAQESHPVVQTYYVPACAHVGPWHQLEFEPGPGRRPLSSYAMTTSTTTERSPTRSTSRFVPPGRPWLDRA